MTNCPKCDADISDSYEPDDRSVGIVGGWYCDACDLGVGEHEVSREPLDDDVPLSPREPSDPTEPIGTPTDKLSGRPGHDGFAAFSRIARSWGYD